MTKNIALNRGKGNLPYLHGKLEWLILFFVMKDTFSHAGLVLGERE